MIMGIKSMLVSISFSFASSFDFLFFLGLLFFSSTTTATFSSIGTIGSVTAAGIGGSTSRRTY
jgi:hypothetical protein